MPRRHRDQEEALLLAQRAERRRQEEERQSREREEGERKQRQREQTEERLKNELKEDRQKRAEELRSGAKECAMSSQILLNQLKTAEPTKHSKV